MARSLRRRSARVLAGIGIIALLTGVLPAAPVEAATDKLPDLRVARMANFRIQRTASGHRLLRFDGMMLNTGLGPLEVRGHRTAVGKPWAVDQVVYRTGGTTRDAQIGFCFFDTNRRSSSLPGAPTSRKYTQAGCGTRTSLSTRTGISVGWADLYPANFAYQWIDITGLPAGTYTIRAAVDLYHQFAEVSETNNCAYARISFKATGTAVKVLSTGTTCLNDHDGTPFAADVDWAAGLIGPCDADMFCTYDKVTRRQVARALARALDLPPAPTDLFSDDNGTAYEADINRVAAAGIMTRCGTRLFCPNGFVGRGVMASFFVRALGLPPTDNDYFTDDETRADEANINAAVAAGIMTGCGPTTFCPATAAKRGETTRWLHHAFEEAMAASARAPGIDAAARLDPGGSMVVAEELIPDWEAVPAPEDPRDRARQPAVGLLVCPVTPRDPPLA